MPHQKPRMELDDEPSVESWTCSFAEATLEAEPKFITRINMVQNNFVRKFSNLDFFFTLEISFYFRTNCYQNKMYLHFTHFAKVSAPKVPRKLELEDFRNR